MLKVFASALAWAFLLLSNPAQAQTYPTKPIKLMVPFGPGTITDTITRIYSHELSLSLGQPVVVVNKGGADGSIGAIETMRSPPDGYSLIVAPNSPIAVVPLMRKVPPYDPLKDFTSISFMGSSTFFIVVNPSVPAKTLQELIGYAKAHPKKLNYASGNTTGIVSTALLARNAGIEMEHIPYKTEPDAIVDLLSGRVHLMNSTPTTVLPHIKSGKLRALATTLTERSPLLPDVPTLIEQGQPKLPVGPWFALVGPAGLPLEIVARMNQEIAAVLANPEVREPMQAQGFAPRSSTPEELKSYMIDQLAVWKTALKAANIPQQ